MHLSSKEYDVGFLTSEFKEVKFKLFASGEDLFMTCIACWCEQANDVVHNWRAMQSILSAYFQPSGNLAKWNIYLVFFCAEQLPLNEKYIIQNDKYSARKVVLDGMNKLPTLEEAEKIINNELLGADLSIKEIQIAGKMEETEKTISNGVLNTNLKNKEAQSSAKHTSNCALVKLISGAPLDMSASSKSKRATIINNIIELVNTK
ncbi:hypothetical protein HQN60_09045 [Deefgea piscis]|uniref:Uncharacterized protein n=1 Tax=Deefgea piscis TaxID=2739061 RepID=A0A6M8SRS9_9NEIS|nr:ABC-three component system middle component 1 [Deefgea piscis]QKJ66834.1 hypothetical protein HQN60_09045 [Deefgea piscis]